MSKMLAVGKVVNGRMTVITADGKGYSRPVTPVVKDVKAGVAMYAPKVQPSVEDTTPYPESIQLMPWVKEWSDRKHTDYKPSKRQTVLSRFAQYIKEELI